MSNIKFTMKDLDGTVVPYTSFVISTSASASAASFVTNANGEATVSLAAVSTPYYISKQDGTTESVIAYKFFVPDTTYTLDAELLFVDMGKISKDKNDKSIAALIEAKVVAVNAANRALQVVSLLGDVSTIRDNLDSLVQVASSIENVVAVANNIESIVSASEGIASISYILPYTANIATVANRIEPLVAVGNNINNINDVRAMESDITAIADNIASITDAAAAVTQAVDAQKDLYIAGTHYTKGVSATLVLTYTPAKTKSVKVFFDGIYQNKNTFTRVNTAITFNEVLNVDTVEIHYEVPSQFIGLDDGDNAVLVAAQNAAQASANAAAASFDSFDDRYLGAKSVAPTVDNDGNTLLVGCMYFNSTENKMYVRNSSNAWQLDTADSSTVNYDGSTVQDVLDTVKPMQSYTALRAYTGRATIVSITTPGIAGFFRKVTSGTDNGGTVIVGAFAWERVFEGAIHSSWFEAVGDGVANDGPALRKFLSAAQDGDALAFGDGPYLVDQDGSNQWHLRIHKAVSVDWGHCTLKASTAGVVTLLHISKKITSTGLPTIDGNYKTNSAVEFTTGSKGTTAFKWVAKNVTQQHRTDFSAAPFSVVSEVGITFDDCDAQNAISYPNSTVGDVAGTARGFHFYGTAPEFGINAVVNSRVENIINTNGLDGNFEDEDGIVCQMAGSFTLIQNNTTTDCMKRGVKAESPALVAKNKVISTRTGADNTLEGNARMYAGISVYGDDSTVVGNKVASETEFGGAGGGSFYYGIEAGRSGFETKGLTVSGNTVKIGATSNARSVELIRLWGALTELNISDNRLSVSVGPTLTNTFGIRSDFDHASVYATVSINGNTIRNTTYPMQLRGGFSGEVSGNHLRGWTGAIGGIIVDTSASALRPKNVLFEGNFGYGVNDYTVRINDTGATGIQAVDNKTESTTVPAVSIAPGIRAFELGSFGGTTRPAQFFGSAPPTAGTWVRGDSAFNHDPRDAAPVVEWRCQYGGAPGTWAAVHWIVTRGATVSRPTLTASDRGVQYMDTTLAAAGKPITWTGTNWVDATGVIV